MRRRGFTIIELLTVIALTAILTAILTPVFAAAKRRGKIASSLGILHQLHVGTMLYQQDYGGSGYGDLPQMGLPNGEFNEGLAEVSPTKSLDLPSPCGLNSLWASDGKKTLFHYVYRPGRGEADFVNEVTATGERYVLFTDINCDDSDGPLYNERFSHLGLGVALGGNAFTRRRVGIILAPEFWAP